MPDKTEPIGTGSAKPETSRAPTQPLDTEKPAPSRDLTIPMPIRTDVLWPNLAKFHLNDGGQLVDPRSLAPTSVGSSIATARSASATKYAGFTQVKTPPFGRTETSITLVEPMARAAGEHWAAEAGGVRVGVITNEGAQAWWLMDPANGMLAAVDARGKVGVSVANARAQHEQLGSVEGRVSAGAEYFLWGTTNVTPTHVDMGAFAGAEAVAVQVSADLKTAPVTVPGTAGLLKMQMSLYGDLNLGGLGGAAGAGAAVSMKEGRARLYAQLGLTPGVGGRAMLIFDASIDKEVATKMGREIDDSLRHDRARQVITRADTVGLPLAADQAEAQAALLLLHTGKAVLPMVVADLKKTAEAVVQDVSGMAGWLRDHIVGHDSAPEHRAAD